MAGEARSEVLKDVSKGLLIALLALVLKIGFEHTALGEQVQISAYNYLQLRLATPGVSEPLPVAVVDISQLEAVPVSSAGWKRSVTPRKQLLELIDAVANSGAKAIGIDVDFAPDQPGYMSDDDPEFFQKCLDISRTTRVPIFLGVYRSQDLAPQAWLGSSDYAALAATVSVRLLDGRRVPRWTKRDADDERGKSLSAALAKSLPQLSTAPPGWLGWAISQVQEERVPNHDVTFGEFLVDYGLLDLIRDKTLKTVNPLVLTDQGQWVLKNKVVLLGDATLGRADTSLVPGQKEPVPGVYLHACAVYTLTRPLYELTAMGRAAIDLALSTLVIGVIAMIRFRARNKDLNIGLLQGSLTLMVVLLAFVVGIVFVRKTRIMWDDFVLAIAVLFLHPSIERWWHLGKTNIVPSLKRLFSK